MAHGMRNAKHTEKNGSPFQCPGSMIDNAKEQN